MGYVSQETGLCRWGSEFYQLSLLGKLAVITRFKKLTFRACKHAYVCAYAYSRAVRVNQASGKALARVQSK